MKALHPSSSLRIGREEGERDKGEGQQSRGQNYVEENFLHLRMVTPMDIMAIPNRARLIC